MTHTTVELNYIDQTIRDIRTSLTVHEAETSIDGDGWWENPTAKTVQEGGIPLYSQLIPKADPSFRYDCHGYTFASGRVWINDDIVDLILSENGYNTFPSQDTRGKTHQ